MPAFSILLISTFVAAAFACNCEVNLPLDPYDALGPWHQRHLDCGIPPFAYRLPQDAQSKIHAIWIKYEPGEDCEEEMTKTRDIIMSIPEEVRFNLFKGVCGPGFLTNESDTVKDAFRKVWFEELSIEQKQAEFKKLGESLLSGNALKRFEKFDKVLSENIKRRQEFLGSLSPTAKEAYNKWNGMRHDERKFLAALSPEIRAELGLICKCCGSCKTGAKTVAQSRATRAVKQVEAIKTDSQLLFESASPECSY